MEISNYNRKRFKLTKENFLILASQIHQNKYNYTLVGELLPNTKVSIICPIHGIFQQYPLDHKNGHGCNKCATNIRKQSRLLTQAEFIEKAQKTHNNKYDYSKVIYINSQTKVLIICPIHGDFFQIPNNHLQNTGCPKCRNFQNSQSRRSNTNDFINKAEKVHFNKYDYSRVNYFTNNQKIDIICPKHGVFQQLPNTHLLGAGCYHCGQDLAHENKSKNYPFIMKANLIHLNKYDYSESEYKNIQMPMRIKCPLHGFFYQKPSIHLKGSGCRACSNQKSKYEEQIQKFLEKYQIKYNHNIKIDNIEVDFQLPVFNKAIEINGLYWHSEQNGKDKKYHLNKTNICEKNNYQLIHIFEDEFQKWNIIQSRLRNILKLIRYKIHGRKCHIQLITPQLKNKFLNKYHIQGEDKSSIHLGAFYKSRLVAVMTFSKFRKALGRKHIENCWELSRYCTISNFIIHGIANKLLTYFEKTYLPEKIITYADRRWSQGNLYTKLGFVLDHISLPNYWYFKRNQRLHRYNFRKNVLAAKLMNFEPNLSEWENMKANGYDRIWDCGNMVFEKQIKRSS